MQLKGSCHCGAVKFSLNTHTPHPYMHCYCTICRKTAGGGGYAINIMGEAASLKVRGQAAVSVYRAKLQGKRSPARRHFCGKCGSALWVADPRWPEWVYPFASAIDTQLPKPRQVQHIMTDFAEPWVDIPRRKHEPHFSQYPEEAIIDWHTKRHLLVP